MDARVTCQRCRIHCLCITGHSTECWTQGLVRWKLCPSAGSASSIWGAEARLVLSHYVLVDFNNLEIVYFLCVVHFNIQRVLVERRNMKLVNIISTDDLARQGHRPVAVSHKMSHHKISQNLKTARFCDKIMRMLWYLTGALAALLPRHLSNFGAIRLWNSKHNSWILRHNLAWSYDNMSYVILKWALRYQEAWWIELISSLLTFWIV